MREICRLSFVAISENSREKTYLLDKQDNKNDQSQECWYLYIAARWPLPELGISRGQSSKGPLPLLCLDNNEVPSQNLPNYRVVQRVSRNAVRQKEGTIKSTFNSANKVQ